MLSLFWINKYAKLDITKKAKFDRSNVVAVQYIYDLIDRLQFTENDWIVNYLFTLVIKFYEHHVDDENVFVSFKFGWMWI